MKNTVKSQNGITLIALVVTIIVLMILAGIGIGELSNNNEDVAQTKNTMALSELSKVQQVVLENYLKYEQLKNDSFLTKIGKKIEDETEYNEINNEFKEISGKDLRAGFNTDIDKSYYKLSGDDLNSMGLENIHNKDVYVVNYSTGEVFNYTQKKTTTGEVLYVYAK